MDVPSNILTLTSTSLRTEGFLILDITIVCEAAARSAVKKTSTPGDTMAVPTLSLQRAGMVAAAEFI